MARIIASNADPIDFCRAHFPDEEPAERLYGNVGDGPDGRGWCYEYDADHPDYNMDEYRCERCDKLLSHADQ